MLPLHQCRKILGPNCSLTDCQLDQLRDQLYALADIVVDAFCDQRTDISGHDQPSSVNVGFADALRLLPVAERETLQERAAIMEFDGELQHSEAERAAFACYLKQKHG